MFRFLLFLIVILLTIGMVKSPELTSEVVGNTIDFVSNIYENVIMEGKGKEKPSPQDHIKESEIKVYDDRVVIERGNMIWSKFSDTNSMDPLLDIGHNGLEIIPESPEEIKVGEIIAYDKGDTRIIHRVVEVGKDNKGWFAIAKGDNNLIADIGKVRFEQVRGILIGIIY